MLRKCILTLLLACALTISAAAAELPEATAPAREQIPPEAQNIMPEEDADFLPGALSVIRKALVTVTPGLKNTAGHCAGILAAAILCALFRAGDTGVGAHTANLLGVAAIGGILLGPTSSLLRQGMETVRSISDYGKLLLPVMASALASSGGATASAGLYLGTALFDSALTSLISGLLRPMLQLFLALSLGAAAIGSDILGRMRDFFRNLITWGLKLVLYLFSGYMAITGVVSGTADAAAVKVAKMTISGAVPVVGGILSDATETVLVGASAVRSAAGVAGLLAVLAITAIPFLELGIQYLLLKLTSALCSVVGNPEQGKLTESFAQAMGLILAMVGTGCLIQLISIVCFMKGVG